MFCNEVVTEIHKMFDEIIHDRRAWGFLRQSKRIPIITSPKEMSSGINIWFSGSKIIEKEKGTFEVSNTDGFHSYRFPHRVSLSFALMSNDIGIDSKVKMLDRLHYFFFENRTLDPIIPGSIRNNIPLFEKMKQMKAELIDCSETKSSLSEEMGFYFPFEYIGPYHSGEFIRKGNLVKYKQLNMSRNTERRLS